jgi:Mlc titration factor MtfA (ptsG expression regulator)
VETLLDILLVCVAVVSIPLAAIVLPSQLRKRRHERLMRNPIPEGWDGILERNVPVYGILPPALKGRLLSLAGVLLAEKRFEGCGGLELNDEMKLTVAAQACLLLLGRQRPSFFPTLETILVYPGAFYSKDQTRLAGQWVDEDDAEKLGESWHGGSIILSWEHVKHEGNMLNDGLNVVLHEFAHQLDEESGFADGAPSLEGSGLGYREWSQLMSREYSSLLSELRRGRRTVVDEYAASNPAEFFAVVTETFFEKPCKLKEKRPKLYAEYSRLFGLDPAAWRENAATGGMEAD